MTKPVSSRYRIGGLAKGLEVLSLFSDRRPELRVKEIAELTGFPMPTAFRIVATLEEAGYLERGAGGECRPSVRVLDLGFAALASSDLVRLATPLLGEVAQRTGRTVNLGVLSGQNVVYLVRHRTRDLVTENLSVGSTLPVPYTSMGKVLLAGLPDAERADLLATMVFPPGAGPKAVRTAAELTAELDAVRELGYATQNEEASAGLRSVAAGVRDDTAAVVAAINIVCPAAVATAEEVQKKYVDLVLETATRLSARLGYRN